MSQANTGTRSATSVLSCWNWVLALRDGGEPGRAMRAAGNIRTFVRLWGGGGLLLPSRKSCAFHSSVMQACA